MRADFTLDDFRAQLQQIVRTDARGPLDRMPGTSEMVLDAEEPNAAMRRVVRMIDAMTPKERRDPDRIDETARLRIAAASGTEPRDVEQLLLQFAQVRECVQQIARMGFWQRLKLVLGFGRLPKRGGT